MNRQRIGQKMFSVTNKLKRIINKRLQVFGISGVQSRTLNYLYRNKDLGDVYQKDIESFLAFRGSSVALMIKSLIDSGFIKRTRSEIDKRKKKLELTTKGEEVALKSILIFDEIESELNATVSKKTYNEFVDLLVSFEEILDLKEKEIDV